MPISNSIFYVCVLQATLTKINMSKRKGDELPTKSAEGKVLKILDERADSVLSGQETTEDSAPPRVAQTGKDDDSWMNYPRKVCARLKELRPGIKVNPVQVHTVYPGCAEKKHHPLVAVNPNKHELILMTKNV